MKAEVLTKAYAAHPISGYPGKSRVVVVTQVDGAVGTVVIPVQFPSTYISQRLLKKCFPETEQHPIVSGCGFTADVFI